jgi:CheY-like chemotaxis protein
MQNQSERSGRPITILMADDDEDDRELAREVLSGARAVRRMEFVADGQDLVDYLRGEGTFAARAPEARPVPSLILLDLNMPRKDGREALVEIKRDRALRRIPVVVLTTSSDDADVQSAYDLGANSFITKPVSGSGLETMLGRVAEYWSQVVTLPEAA